MGKGEDYRLGSDEAPIVIHEFVDFECPACAMASRALKDLKTEFPSAVLLVFRNYPLDKSCNDNIKKDFHKNSCALAQLARCAGRKGKFWEFHDLAFNGQKSASLEKASEWALSVGLSQFEINNCLQDDAVLAKIRDDISQGDKLGVEGTPAIFVNGKKFEGDFQTLKNFVQVQIKSH
jgi:protein-disulfide isomerase